MKKIDKALGVLVFLIAVAILLSYALVNAQEANRIENERIYMCSRLPKELRGGFDGCNN